MAKKVQTTVKLQLPASKATPAPPVGAALGPHGVNIMDFCKQFNAKTAKEPDGMIIPVLVTIYTDRTFTFIMKTPPASELLKREERGNVACRYADAGAYDFLEHPVPVRGYRQSFGAHHHPAKQARNFVPRLLQRRIIVGPDTK